MLQSERVYIECTWTKNPQFQQYDEILNEEEEEEPRTLTLHNPHKITRCAATKTIKTVSQNKMHKLVFDKRVIDHDTFQSFPYGYKCSFYKCGL